MSQSGQRDLEGGGYPGPDAHRDQPQLTSNQPTGNQPFQPWESIHDGSWLIYSMYSKIAEEDDNKTVERSQKQTDGVLIFTGLFFATVGALLTVSIPDLKSNSQDTSAFYLENIYQLFGNLNVSYPSIQSTLAKPPAFSPPRYAVWVNSLWFLSLFVSLTGAMRATIIRSWAVYYTETTDQPWYTLAKRVRMRALFSEGMPGPYTLWGLGIETHYLHFSLLLFTAGCLIYLFNINRVIFYAVVWWVVYTAYPYALVTVTAFFNPHDLIHTPLSWPVLQIYLGICFVLFQVCSCLPPLLGFHNDIRRHYCNLRNHYGEGLLVGKWKIAEDYVSKPSSEIDSLILDRILPTLDEDRELEAFLDAIPSFCNSKLCALPLSFRVQTGLRQALDIFLNHTFASSSIAESARTGRLITCLNAAQAALGPNAVSHILVKILDGRYEEALKSVEIGHALNSWGHSWDHDLNIRQIVACIIPRVQGRDDRWILLVKETFGVPDRVFRDYLADGDSVLLSILIHVSRQASRADPFTWGILSSLSRFDIHDTLPGLQHEFRTLWNEIDQEARNQGQFSTLFLILDEIRHLYITLHQNSHATPTPSSTPSDSLAQGADAGHAPFSSSTDSSDFIPNQLWSYPSCNIASYRRPDSTTHDPVAISEIVPLPTQPSDSLNASPHRSTLEYNTALQQPKETNIITGVPSPSDWPDPSTTSEIREDSHAFTATFPVHSCLPLSDRPPQNDVATMQPESTPSNSSYPIESDGQQGPATPYAAFLVENSATLPTPAPLPTSTSPVPNKSSTTYNESPTFISTSSLPGLSSGFPAPDPLLSPPVPSLPNAKLPSLRSGMSQDPSDNATPSRLHSCTLVNNGDMPANAVLQLLVYCPPFKDLLRDAQLVGQREGRMSGRSVTSLMDASVRFLDEFAYKEKSSVAHRFLQRAGGSKVREDEDGEKEDGPRGVHLFRSTDVFDTMKEKRQFVIMRDDLRQDAVVFLGLYLEALNEELVTLRSSIGTHRRASILKVEELEEEGQPSESQTEMRERDYMASSVKSPISRIFGGRFRSILRAPNQPNVVTVEDWRSLQLNIQPNSVHTIQDSLTQISQPQPVEVEIGQSGSSEASQQVLLEALPSILVLHLERFLYDAATDGVNKISKFVQFAPEFEIPLEIMAPVSGKSAEPVFYKLHGVLYHHGESASSGHYTVDVLHRNGDSDSGEAWLHIDDEAVSAVQHEDVFGNHANESEDDRCAYMLFYCRAAPARA